MVGDTVGIVLNIVGLVFLAFWMIQTRVLIGKIDPIRKLVEKSITDLKDDQVAIASFTFARVKEGSPEHEALVAVTQEEESETTVH